MLSAILNLFSNKESRIGVVTIGSDLQEFAEPLIYDRLLFQRGAKVINLDTQNSNQIIKSLSAHVLKCQIIHLEIERSKELQFGAYDNFSHISFGTDLTVTFLNNLVERSIIETFNVK